MKITGKHIVIGIVVLLILGYIGDQLQHPPLPPNDVKHTVFDNDTKGIESNYKVSLEVCNMKDVSKKERPKCIADADDLRQRMIEAGDSKKTTDDLITNHLPLFLSDCRESLKNKMGIDRLDFIDGEIWANVDKTITLRSFIGTTKGMYRYTCSWDAKDQNNVNIISVVSF